MTPAPRVHRASLRRKALDTSNHRGHLAILVGPERDLAFADQS